MAAGRRASGTRFRASARMLATSAPLILPSADRAASATIGSPAAANFASAAVLAASRRWPSTPQMQTAAVPLVRARAVRSAAAALGLGLGWSAQQAMWLVLGSASIFSRTGMHASEPMRASTWHAWSLASRSACFASRAMSPRSVWRKRAALPAIRWSSVAMFWTGAWSWPAL